MAKKKKAKIDHADMREIEQSLIELEWEDFSKMEDWQLDRLERYAASDTSEEYFDNEMIQSMKERCSSSKSDDPNEEESPVITLEENEDLIKKYPQLWSAFVLLKLTNVEPEKQAFPPRTNRTNFWGESDHDSETSEGPPVVVDAEFQGMTLSASSIEISDQEDADLTAKERKRAKRKKLNESKSKDNKEKLVQETDKEQETKPTNAEVQDSQTSKSQLYRTNISNEYFSDSDMIQIDKCYESNFIKRTAKFIYKDEVNNLPEELRYKADEPPINVAPSLKEMTASGLNKLGLDYFLHRVMYIFSFERRTHMKGFKTDVTMKLRGYVAEQNASYTAKYFISGCLFYYRDIAVVVVEGGEHEIMRHFLEMRGTPMLKEFVTPKILYNETYAKTRFFKTFLTCTAKKLGPRETFDKIKMDDILKSFNSKMEKLYRLVARIESTIVKPGKTFGLPGSVTSDLPSYSQMKFILEYKALRKLAAYVNQFLEVPRISDSSDEGWPAEEIAIPQNIFDPDPREQHDLEQEMTEQIKNKNVIGEKREMEDEEDDDEGKEKNEIELLLKKTKKKKKRKKVQPKEKQRPSSGEMDWSTESD